MALYLLTILMIAGADAISPKEKEAATNEINVDSMVIEPANEDLKSDASTWYSNPYSRWSQDFGHGGNDITGYGTIEDKNYYGGSYDSPHGHHEYGYKGENGYAGYDGHTRHNGNRGYSNYGGNGGYGGYGGNGGLNSYSGYDNINYRGANHLGYGYYNKRLGYGNIYNNGITPNLVTGYRGYSK